MLGALGFAGVLWKMILSRQPRCFFFKADVCLGLAVERSCEVGDRDVDLLWCFVAVIKEGRPAVTAKAPADSGVGFVFFDFGFAREKFELCERDCGPRDECGAVSTAAILAVAMGAELSWKCQLDANSCAVALGYNGTILHKAVP